MIPTIPYTVPYANIANVSQAGVETGGANTRSIVPYKLK